MTKLMPFSRPDGVLRGGVLLDIPARAGLSTIRGDAAPQITFTGDTFNISGVENGTDATGYGQYIVVPTGTETITGLGPETVGGDLVSGAMLDPVVETNQHGLDARVGVGSTYDAALIQGATIDVTAGNIILKARSNETPVTSGPHDDGYLDAVKPLWVVDTALGTNEVLLSAVGWSGRPTTRVATVDLAARYAALTKRDMSGQASLPDYATIKARLVKYPAAYAVVRSTLSTAGYENLVPEGFNDQTGNGYDRENAETIHAAGCIILDDGTQYTYDQRFDIYCLLVRIGLDCALPYIESATSMGPDGGHFQSMILPAALALHALGRESEIANLDTTLGGSLEQWFDIDAAFVADQWVPHNDLGKSSLYRNRILGDQSGLTSTQVRIPTEYGGSGGVQGDWQQTDIPPGSILMRPSDFAFATVTSPASFPSGSSGTLVVDLDSALVPPLASDDVIHFTQPPGFTIGDVGWSLRGRQTNRESYITLAATNTYTDQRREGDAMRLMQELGILPSTGILPGVRDFCDLALTVDWPSANNNWPAQGTRYVSGGTLDFPSASLSVSAVGTRVFSESSPGSINVPLAAHSTGDRMFIAAVVPGDKTATEPSGWTMHTQFAASTSSTSPRLALMSREMDGTEGATASVGVSFGRITAVALTVPGATGIGQISQNTESNALVTTADATTITPAGSGGLTVSAWASRGFGANHTLPTGADFESLDETGTTYRISVVAYPSDNNPTPARTITAASASRWATVQVEIV